MAVLLRQPDDWARQSVLLEPDSCRGQSGQLLVELSHDRPLRAETATLLDGFRGWVLRAAPGYVKLCQMFDQTTHGLQVSGHTP